ncbi:hypothetical protein O6H91_11G010900 [Diphasiastrum complanatum]|uniref:Uncharacterized protein n=3 Tax=Diphasiastrum complanatum TaxID=34168 RepID=A0ACC2C6P2_DIPCM|nr:hypothetical protein O6H91_11G010000 [Diphasiastrum complanatum]KAJ7537548.1 hypothetical protein O6H91_11G010900 [Diphasiastrum complanatum]KAJ7537549.1 hypothetical protein O6H91_11G010900 [Diphasiastrum complanatum]
MGSAVDNFDRLPDSLVLAVFNRLADIKALGRCCAVSRRFNYLAPQVDNVVVKVDCVISGEENGSLTVKGRGILAHFLRFFYGSILKPFQTLQQHLVGGAKKSKAGDVSHHSPGEVLKNFKDIQSLRIELPGGELGIEQGVLLKWKADFGSTLESCAILGASSLVKVKNKAIAERLGREKAREGSEEAHVSGTPPYQDDNGSIPESFYSDGRLKMRVVWTISSLIAASARHYLLQQIIFDHPTLESLVLTDADGQGTLCLNSEQLKEFRRKPLATSASSNRTQVPALNIKLWYAPSVELPDGTCLKGATLVAIRPSDQPPQKNCEDFLPSAFEEPFKAAVNLLIRRRTYLLEMNSF